MNQPRPTREIVTRSIEGLRVTGVIVGYGHELSCTKLPIRDDIASAELVAAEEHLPADRDRDNSETLAQNWEASLDHQPGPLIGASWEVPCRFQHLHGLVLRTVTLGGLELWLLRGLTPCRTDDHLKRWILANIATVVKVISVVSTYVLETTNVMVPSVHPAVCSSTTG